MAWYLSRKKVTILDPDPDKNGRDPSVIDSESTKPLSVLKPLKKINFFLLYFMQLFIADATIFLKMF